MAALDDVDSVDLHIAEMRHRLGNGSGAVTERRAPVQPLRPQPDAAGDFGVDG